MANSVVAAARSDAYGLRGRKPDPAQGRHALRHAALSQFADASWPGRPPLPAEDIFGNTKKLRFILRSIDDHRARLGRVVRVLDFGCGNAAAVGQYLIGAGVDYVGVDFHEPSLAYARANFGGA